MERSERLKWIKISSEVNKNPNSEYRCPKNEEHIISYEIKDFEKYGKREIKLLCKECNKEMTFTLDIPKM